MDFILVLISLVMWGISSWVPSYLVMARHLTLMEAGKMQVLPVLFGGVAMLLCGYVIDKMKTPLVRIIGIIMSVVAAASLYLMFSTPNLTLFLVYEGIALACVTALTVVMSNLIMRRVPNNIVGTAMGFYNFGAQIGGFTAPLAMGIIVDANKGSFNLAFIFLTVMSTIAAIAFITTFFEKKQPTIGDTPTTVL